MARTTVALFISGVDGGDDHAVINVDQYFVKYRLHWTPPLL